VIAHAHSTDLLQWEVLPPITQPGNFGMLEVPQLVKIKELYYLLFCTTDWSHSSQWQTQTGRKPVTGLHYFIADSPLGLFHLPTDKFLLGDEIGSHYTAKIITTPEGKWGLMTTHHFSPQGDFLGDISDLLPLNITIDGNLVVENPKTKHE
jgi:beta-fructofuranosidase